MHQRTRSLETESRRPSLSSWGEGSMDPRRLTEAARPLWRGYETIRKLLLTRGYERNEEQPFIFFRTLDVKGKVIRVEVDLLAGEYGGTPLKRRTQKIQDIRASALGRRGAVIWHSTSSRKWSSRARYRTEPKTKRVSV